MRPVALAVFVGVLGASPVYAQDFYALVIEEERRPGQPQVAYGLALEGPMGW
jgi:hypothetical protein